MYDDVIHFIRDLYKTNDVIPLHQPLFNGNEKKYVLETIDSTFVSSVGAFVDRFEKDFAQYTGTKFAVCVVNGTSALHIALLLAGVEQEHEVITQSLTFVATVNAISYLKAKPIFLDVNKQSLGLCPEKLEYFLKHNTEVRDGNCYNLKTGKIIKACVPVHIFGFPAYPDKIKKICDEYHIEMVEDAAEALGSFYHDKHIGSDGRLAAFSFNGNKVMTTGGGGMIVTNDQELAQKAKHLTTTAKQKHPWEYIHDHVAYNYRMPNINAALGCAQLESLPYFLERKRWLSQQYKSFFENIDIEYKQEESHTKANYWLNFILLKNKDEREKFLKETNENGILTRPIWKPIHELAMYHNCQKDDLTNTQWLYERGVNIPSTVIVEN